ncbi:MAG TPA: hypothetical protein VK850_00960 [Candidatus Binatia bacterium]|nr:hypothetical protein [Candidatus Binatia bacterium]
MTSPIAIRAYVFILAAVVIAVVVIRSNRVTIVSANELIQRATEAQAARINATMQPVVHQKLQLKAKSQTHEESVNWEVWHEMHNSRFRSFVTNQTSAADILNDLTRVFQANQMDPKRPLSAASYQAWRGSLAGKQEDVAKIKLADGAEAMTLRTFPAGAVNEGQIAEATFTVRSADWHPVEQKLTVKTANGSTVYELIETQSEVVSLNQISPAIFGPEQPTVVKADTKASPSLSPNANVGPTTPSPNAIAPVASAELEVEVLQLLHQAGADLGEQITVKRTAGRPVRVSGIVETVQRKAEILAALNSLAGNPAVQIDIQTVAEAVAKQKSRRLTSPRAVTSEGVEIQSTGIAAEPALRAYFERRGAATDSAVRQFAVDMVRKSHQAMQHLGALRRLVNQFSAGQLRALTPDARAKWLALVRAQARDYRQESAALLSDLKPIFFPGASDGLPGSLTIRSDEELKQAIQELFAAGAANDQRISSAFTVTSGGAPVPAINTPEFWQAMKRAEALAARISNAQ